MQPDSKNGPAKTNEETLQAGTSFLVTGGPTPIFDAVEETRIKEELQNSKENIQKLFAAFE